MPGHASASVESATRTIIVARSHPTMAKALVRFLAGIDYTPCGYDGTSSLGFVTRDDVRGALIATGPTVDVEQSPVEVLARLRALRPELPVAFVSLVSFDRLRRSLSRQLGPSMEMIEGSALALRKPDLGAHTVLPVIHFDDIVTSHDSDTTSAILARHFRGLRRRWHPTRPTRSSAPTSGSAAARTS